MRERAAARGSARRPCGEIWSVICDPAFQARPLRILDPIESVMLGEAARGTSGTNDNVCAARGDHARSARKAGLAVRLGASRGQRILSGRPSALAQGVPRIWPVTVRVFRARRTGRIACGDGIAVVVLTHNRVHLLPKCVENVLLRTSAATREIVIWNNASTDGTAELSRLARRSADLASSTAEQNIGQNALRRGVPTDDARPTSSSSTTTSSTRRPAGTHSARRVQARSLDRVPGGRPRGRPARPRLPLATPRPPSRVHARSRRTACGCSRARRAAAAR